MLRRIFLLLFVPNPKIPLHKKLNIKQLYKEDIEKLLIKLQTIRDLLIYHL